jgi:hypothetical protein
MAASFAASGAGQCAPALIKLLPQQLSQIETKGMPAGMQASLARMPANYHHFGVAVVGKPATPETLKFEFSASTTVTKISSTRDFTIVAGGTCEVGHRYGKGSTCQLRVQFTPRGAGPRLGKIVLETGTGRLVQFSALGYYYTPVISFTPSTITTVPATISGGVGQILSAKNIAIDNGDGLIIADTGNNLIRYVNSSGTAKTLASGFQAPWGVTEDQFGEIYFSQPAANALHEIYDYGPVVQINGAGTGACPASAPCTLISHAVNSPGELSIDPFDHMFFTERTSGGAFSTVQPLPASLIFLYDPFPYQTNPQGPAAIDANDNIYSFWTLANCQIVQQSLFNAENSKVAFVNIAGGHTCGFSGDGGRAGRAEIGNAVGQMAFDAAGNLYFTDSNNQRVRRIDASTGIIRTIAGDGAVGYTGDNGPATKATLSTPTGLAVDSLGQVYILTHTKTPPQQVVRVVGTTGNLAFGSVRHGTSTLLILRVANTGNTAATFDGYAFGGTNRTDFQIDTTSTNCNLAAGGILNAGQSCRITVVFTPHAVGARSAVLRLLDNTVNDMSVVTLTGRGK